MRAYLDFSTGYRDGFKVAREVAAKYANYPVVAWRLMFEEIRAQLEEQEDVGEIDQEDEEKRKENLKKSRKLEPVLQFSLEGSDMVVDYENIAAVTFKFYVIDVEILFSRTPFLMKDNEDFSYIKPSFVLEQPLDKASKTNVLAIPENLRTSNLVIEAVGAGKQVF